MAKPVPDLVGTKREGARPEEADPASRGGTPRRSPSCSDYFNCLTNPTMRETLPPRIYVADLAAYNAGELHGEWVELTETSTVEDVRAAIAAMLERSPVLPDVVPEEYAIHDYEGLHGYEMDEYEHLETVVKVGAFVAEHGELGALLINHSDDVDDAAHALEERYAGAGDSLRDWIEDYLDDTGQLDEMPERWHAYIDFERYANDLELGGDIFTVSTSDGLVHVFWTS